jgi:hypothetical protein
MVGIMERPNRARLTTHLLWVPALSLALAACTPSADEVRVRHEGTASQATSAQPAARKAVSTSPSEADYVAAVSSSKATLPFVARFRLAERPHAGQPLTIDFLITPAPLAQIRSLKFHFEAGEGVQLQGDPEFVVNGATAGISVHHELQVVPRTTGVIEVLAHAAVETSSEALSQTYAIPLIVTDTAP